jgi:hypothetical protein
MRPRAKVKRVAHMRLNFGVGLSLALGLMVRSGTQAELTKRNV